MKRIIILLLILVILIFSIGFYMQIKEHPKGNLVVGIAVLSMMFVLIPVFLIHRYKGKNIKDYTLDDKKIKELIDNCTF